MNELQKTNGGAMMQTTTTTSPAFNFFDPVQFDTMQRVCSFFASSDLVPDNYKAQLKPFPAGADENTIAAIKAENTAIKTKAIANCMIAVEVASRIGASPLMVMQNMAVIYGRPSWSSKFLIATVNSCGRFEPLQFRFTDKGALGMVDYTDYTYNPQTRRKEAITKQFDGKKIHDIECVAFTTKRGSEGVLESSPVSVRLAVQEGWYTKNGSKWQTMTKQMLMYRAASMWTNAYAPELSMGMRTVEEQQDIYTEYEDVTAEVAAEKENNANKKRISLDMGNGKKQVVDTETGEIQSEKPAAKETPDNAPKAPENANNTPNPGF